MGKCNHAWLLFIKKEFIGQAWWLTSIIPELLEDEAGVSGDQDHPGQNGETVSLPKRQKLAGYGGVCL